MRTRPDKQIKISECSIDDLRAEIGSLAEEHWLELEDSKKLFKLSIDWASYEEVEANGKLITLVVRNEGEVIGYSVTMLYMPIHSDTVLIGINSALFLRKEHRSGGLGARLILATESAARQHGARAMNWHAKPATAMSQVMERMGYEVRHTTYSRSI